jgi:hypothetical protein
MTLKETFLQEQDELDQAIHELDERTVTVVHPDGTVETIPVLTETIN